MAFGMYKLIMTFFFLPGAIFAPGIYYKQSFMQEEMIETGQFRKKLTVMQILKNKPGEKGIKLNFYKLAALYHLPDSANGFTASRLLLEESFKNQRPVLVSFKSAGSTIITEVKPCPPGTQNEWE